MDQQGQPAAPGPGGQPLQPAVVVDVAVGDDDGPQPGRVDLHDLEVVAEALGGHAAVVQDRAAAPAGEDRDQGREAVLGHQLLAVGEVVGQREPANALGPRHEDVDVVVDHQGDLDRIHGLQLDHAR